MAATETTSSAARGRSLPRRNRRSRSRRQLRLVWVAGLLALSAYLYYRPLASYFGTRHDLAAQQASLQSLRTRKADLDLRLRSATSLQATRREARRIGYVRPGEQLFVVKGIPAWREARRSVGRHG